jgi:hypothetical protein
LRIGGRIRPEERKKEPENEEKEEYGRTEKGRIKEEEEDGEEVNKKTYSFSVSSPYVMMSVSKRNLNIHHYRVHTNPSLYLYQFTPHSHIFLPFTPRFPKWPFRLIPTIIFCMHFSPPSLKNAKLSL